MALVLAIDIRNTRTRIGLALDGRLVSQWAVPTDPDETADGAVACVLGFFDALARGLAPIEEGAPGAIDLPESAPLADGAIIASVIPALTGVWADAARRLTDARRSPWAGPEDGPQDELLRSCGRGRRPRRRDGGRQEHLRRARPSSSIWVPPPPSSFWTRREPSAAASSPRAMKLGAQALARGAAQLAAVELRAPKSLLGRTTVEAMQAGIVMGEVARIDGLIDMIWADCGYTTPVILVGQDAETIAALMAHAVTVDQTLALRGLLELYTANTRR